MPATPKKFSSSFFIVLTLSLTLFLIPQVLYAQEDFLPAKVKDISDRAYEPAVVELLDGAKESIVISMYSISLATKTTNPIRLLLEDLLEARERNVKVTLYLNTKFQDVNKIPRLIQDPLFKRLEDAGCTVHLMPPIHRIHDKLIIVDSRYVIEGSTNWSITALRNSFESATLIDSPELAKIKLSRLKMRYLTIRPKVEAPRKPIYIEGLPQTLTLPQTLLLDKRYFSKMVTNYDNRSFNLYLLLLAHSQSIEKQKFFINLEAMALSLSMPDSWTDTALRRQVIKSLKRLKSNYQLINVQFFPSKDAWIELISLSGNNFSIPSKLIYPDLKKKLSLRLKFFLMLKALLEAQGEDIFSISQRKLSRRFHVSRSVISEALKELKGEEEIK